MSSMMSRSRRSRILRVLHEQNVQMLALAHAAVDLEQLEARQQRRRRRWWVRPIYVSRPLHGHYDCLMQELHLDDHTTFKEFLRVDEATFHDLLARVEVRITRQTTNARLPISPGMKLAFTLRFLATGNYYRDMRFSFRVAHNTMSKLILEVCQALVDVMEDEFIKIPTVAEEWQAVAHDFQQKWQFPHTLGALDGKHIRITKPPHGGSLYYNYKQFDSIVMMALVDANYKFLWVQIGDAGSCSDGQIWNHCDLQAALSTGVLGVPVADPLPGDNVNTPYFIIADDAFAMKTHLMKPFPRRGLEGAERVFNYRLSRARRVVENAFGILANRFRCLLTTMHIRVQRVPLIVRTCVVLHNYLRVRYPGADNHVVDLENADHQLIPGAWRTDAVMADVNQRQCGNRDSQAAKTQRLDLKNYFMSPAGSVPWQDRMV